MWIVVLIRNLVSSALKVHHLKTKTKDSVKIKGSLFVDLPKSYQKPSAAKKVIARRNSFCPGSKASPGQNKGNTRKFKGQKKTNKDIKRQA